MFLFLLVLALVRRGESGDGVQLNKCLDPSTVPIARPLPSPSACKDKNPVICNAIFSVRSGAVVNNAVAYVFSEFFPILFIFPDVNYQNNEVYCRRNNFLVNPNCQNETRLLWRMLKHYAPRHVPFAV